MASVGIDRYIRKSGIRYRVRYRLGGRSAKVVHAGSFKSLIEAEKHRDWISLQIAACTLVPEQARPEKQRAELVYFARLGSLIKIGVSVAPEQRVRDLNAELLLVEPGGRLRESELHATFASARERGEWFRDDGRIRRYIESRDRDPEAASPTEGMRP